MLSEITGYMKIKRSHKSICEALYNFVQYWHSDKYWMDMDNETLKSWNQYIDAATNIQKKIWLCTKRMTGDSWNSEE